MSITRRDFLEATALGAAIAGAPGLLTPAAAATPGGAGTCAAFGLPPVRQRAMFRWWWPGGYITPEEIEREVNAMADAGFGGFEIADVRDGLTVPMDPKLYGWGTARWVAGVERALEVAYRRGMKADITIGAHWPTGMPGITPDHPAAAKELVHGAAVLQGGERYNAALPVSTVPVTGASMHPTPPQVTPQLVALQAFRQVGTQGDTVVLDPASRVDLAARVVDGALDWTAPAGGTWHLLAFWMRGTAQIQNMFAMNRKTSMLADPIPYVVDVYGQEGAQACIDFWEQHLLPPRTRALLRRIGGCFFEDSLELNAVKEWSCGLPGEFQQRRGYELLPYLPLMAVARGGSGPAFGGPGRAAPYALAGVETERFEHDLGKTFTEMYALNRVKRLGDWAATLGMGMGMRVQCAGLAASYATVPEGDNGDNIDSFSGKAAARDIGGHTLLSDEAATFVGGQSSVANWRLLLFMLQRDYAGGVNQVVLHGFSYADSPGATWPGFSAFGRAIGEDWGPRSPHWQQASEVSGYLARLQRVLQSGRSQADVAVLAGAGGGGASGPPGRREGSSLGEQLRLAGYTSHTIAEDLLTHPKAVVRNRRLAPEGAGYRALLVSAAASREATTAQRMLEYAQAGLPVILIGEPPRDVPGLQDVAARRSTLRDAYAQLARFGSVVRVADEAAALARCRWQASSLRLATRRSRAVLGLVREAGRTNYYYFLNDTDADNALGVSLHGTGTPLRINLWDGSVEPVAVYTQANGRTEIPLRFRGSEAVVLALTTDPALCTPPAAHATASDVELCYVNGRLAARAGSAGRYGAMLADGSAASVDVGAVDEPRELTDWSLTVESWAPGASATETRKSVVQVPLPALTAWTNIPALHDVSGIGRYRTTVEVANVGAGRGMWIDLGALGGTYRVFVNGAQAAAGQPVPSAHRYRPVPQGRAEHDRGGDRHDAQQRAARQPHHQQLRPAAGRRRSARSTGCSGRRGRAAANGRARAAPPPTLIRRCVRPPAWTGARRRAGAMAA
ncbi:MAG: glycosyl hydrolase [Steroidobacteraceae bacterium]